MSKRNRAYLAGVRTTIPDDLPDGAWLAMMGERGLDPLDDVPDFDQALDVHKEQAKRPSRKRKR